MKKIILFIFTLFAFAAFSEIQAKGVIIYHNGDTFTTAKELPAEQKIDGKHVNLGVAFQQFGLFWLPLWNYGDVTYALVTDDEEQAWALDAEDVALLKSEYNLDISDEPSIPLWHKIGLKPIVIILILLIIWGQIPSKKKREENEEGEENMQADNNAPE